MDKALSALLADLKQRGMLDDTLLICGAEFGRTPMKENRDGKDNPFAGRDHSPGGFTIWLTGGGVKRGLSYGETDDFGYEAIKDKVHVHDFNATLLRLLGFDHEKLTYFFQGRHYRLTDVRGQVVKAILS
jgi:arylsulfatase A-like enzyme